MTTALFLLKRREDYSTDPSYSGSYQIATGMWNSAKFVVDTLNQNNIPAEVQIVVDGNCIDRYCMQHDPSVVFIEGLWVTPAKLQELMGLARHAHRTWVVRIHSEIPFLATEGIAMDWIGEYLKIGATVAPNAPRAHEQLKAFASMIGLSNSDVASRVIYLPNCFPTEFRAIASAELDTSEKETLDVACFGAYRPLKNHLQQALVAMQFAAKHGKKLRFHVNDRKDQGGQSVFKNVEGMFRHLHSDKFELVVHGWEDRETFLQSLENIDLLMQDSLSETFNIVAADATLVGRPVLGNKEIPWLYPLYSDPTDQTAMMKVLDTIWANKSFFVNQNRQRLRSYALQSEGVWVRLLKR